jgi:hypothetical protein
VLAQSITSRSWAALLFGDVAAGSAFVIIVIDAICGWLFHFIDGVEGVNCHWTILLESEEAYHWI